MNSRHVLQPDALGHGRCHLDFLADTINEVEMAFGEEDGQGNTRETAACTHVHDGGPWAEANDLGNTERVEDMVRIEVVNILARNHVYLGVPVAVQGIKPLKLPALFVRQIWEVVKDKLGCGNSFYHKQN